MADDHASQLLEALSLCPEALQELSKGLMPSLMKNLTALAQKWPEVESDEASNGKGDISEEEAKNGSGANNGSDVHNCNGANISNEAINGSETNTGNGANNGNKANTGYRANNSNETINTGNEVNYYG